VVDFGVVAGLCDTFKMAEYLHFNVDRGIPSEHLTQHTKTGTHQQRQYFDSTGKNY
jgi:hypothetical protein